MSNAVVSAFKNKQLRKKLLFTTLILIVVRFGSQLPIPEIDSAQISAYLKSTLGDFVQPIELFYRRLLHADVSICVKCNSVYHIFHYHAADDDRYSSS